MIYLFMHASEYELSRMTEDDLLAMELTAPHYPPEVFESMTYGLRNPTGVWRDYAEAFLYHEYLQYTMAIRISSEYLPAAPLIEDYADTTAPKTDGFPKRAETGI